MVTETYDLHGMPHKNRACARVYALGDTMLFAPVFSDGVEEAFDPWGETTVLTSLSDPNEIQRVLLETLSQYRVTNKRFGRQLFELTLSDKALEQQLVDAFGKSSLEETYAKRHLVEVVRADGCLRFIPKRGVGDGFFRELLVEEITIADNAEPARIADMLYEALRYVGFERHIKLEPGQSALIEHVMPGASVEEKAEATRHWFGFLKTLIRIVEDREKEERDNMSGRKEM